MKSQEEIELRLTEAEAELNNLNEWYDSAYQNYLYDKKMWGEADGGECRHAESEAKKIKREIGVLKWVLNK